MHRDSVKSFCLFFSLLVPLLDSLLIIPEIMRLISQANTNFSHGRDSSF